MFGWLKRWWKGTAEWEQIARLTAALEKKTEECDVRTGSLDAKNRIIDAIDKSRSKLEEENKILLRDREYWSEEATKQLKRAENLEGENADMRRRVKAIEECREWWRRQMAMLDEAQMLPEEVRYQLGKTEEGEPLWIAVRKVVVGALRDAESAAKIPGLSDGDRHFNVGRCGGIEDVLALLESVRAESRREMEERAAQTKAA